MPAAYALIQVDVFDPEAFDAYRAHAPETIQRYGGEYIVRGGVYEVLEGPDPLPRLVVIRFPSMSAAKDWYGSPDYRKLLAVRQRSAKTNLVLVEGM